MFENVKKEDLVTVLVEMGEIDPGMNEVDLKQKLMQSNAYVYDEEFVKDILATMIEDRRKREHELTLVRIRETRYIEKRSPSVHNNGDGEVSIDKLMKGVEYYCKLRKVKDLETLKELTIADKIFQSLDRETASHIAIYQGEKWLRPQELAKQCDIYFGAKQKHFNEVANDVRQIMPSGKYVPPHQRRENTTAGINIPRGRDCYICRSQQHFARQCPDRRIKKGFTQSTRNPIPNSSANDTANRESVEARVESSYLKSEHN
ncbi:retrovirus-related Pol polyprotein from transposon opus [Trichonephila clavipes]|nr:retrovirus-related Pol polyprotein from transposon opus [Trichonephila clavipes]